MIIPSKQLHKEVHEVTFSPNGDAVYHVTLYFTPMCTWIHLHEFLQITQWMTILYPIQANASQPYLTLAALLEMMAKFRFKIFISVSYCVMYDKLVK